jgi:2-desacetyl-2-hydroxyethyl bacteriochlorophyllide A dehydrogenase
MKSVYVTGPEANGWVDIAKPSAGSADILLKIKACGICASDAFYTHIGGIPPRQGATPLGHEAAGEVIEVGTQVDGVRVGDHVVIDTTHFSDGILGGGGAQGALSEYVVVKDAVIGRQIRVVPKDIPWEVLALNEPMAVAHHAVNRSGATAGNKAVVFGAGPIGLGAVISLKARGVEHVVVADIAPKRLELARRVGADAVINSAEQDLTEQLIQLHGAATDAVGAGPKAGTDVYIDAAGVPSVILTALKAAKHKAVLCIVALHKVPVEIDLSHLLPSELDIRLSMGYPTEIFEVTDAIIEHQQQYAALISHTVPFDKALEALELAKTPGAAEKVVITFE